MVKQRFENNGGLLLSASIRVKPCLPAFEGKITWDTSKPNGQPRRKLDISRAKEKFGFEAKSNFEDGLRRTIEWYASLIS